MSNSSHSIPEPLLPEHQLLADAAPQIELSANFRSQVLAECSASHAMAQKVFAAKVAAGILAALLAAVLAYVMWNSEPEYSPKLPRPAAAQPAVQLGPQQTSQPSVSPISSGRSSSPTIELSNETAKKIEVPQ